MSFEPGELLKHKAINTWNLFWLISGPISIAMIIAMTGVDLASAEGISSMIQLSVRCAVPWLYLAFAASSIQVLFPGPFGRWILCNRKYLGLCFAAAMAWQLLFILWLVTVHTDYYVEEVYVMRDAIEGVVGYAFLVAMTLTSFRFARKHLKPRQWRLLHLSGIYFLWAYAFSVYWWELFYYSDPVVIDYVYYWGGFLTWGLRSAAWYKKRRKLAAKSATPGSNQPALVLAGLATVGAGLIAASFGSLWRETVSDMLTGYSFTQIPELYLPNWPFEPFLPLFVIALGVLLMTKADGYN